MLADVKNGQIGMCVGAHLRSRRDDAVIFGEKLELKKASPHSLHDTTASGSETRVGSTVPEEL